MGCRGVLFSHPLGLHAQILRWWLPATASLWLAVIASTYYTLTSGSLPRQRFATPRSPLAVASQRFPLVRDAPPLMTRRQPYQRVGALGGASSCVRIYAGLWGCGVWKVRTAVRSA